MRPLHELIDTARSRITHTRGRIGQWAIGGGPNLPHLYSSPAETLINQCQSKAEPGEAPSALPFDTGHQTEAQRPAETPIAIVGDLNTAFSTGSDLVQAEIDLAENGRTSVHAGPLDPKHPKRRLTPEDLPAIAAGIDAIGDRIANSQTP
jgi:hypothetical protein